MKLEALALECPCCRADELDFGAVDLDGVTDRALTCLRCGEAYASMWGVPFLGAFARDDVLTLLEIASGSHRLRSDAKQDLGFRGVLRALDEYAASTDKESVLRRHGLFPQPYWWSHRFHEHVQFKIVTAPFDFRGKRVLDVGSGFGSDSLRYAVLGAEVTCFEYSFSMFGPGIRTYPELQWVGGAAHCLPFRAEHFDFVVAHNSLHHHTDQTQSLREMLRVLKTGGTLITVGDPFRPTTNTELEECRVFNAHPGVLNGVNEQIVRFGKFVDALQPFEKQLQGYMLFEQGTRLQRVDFPAALRALSSEDGGLSIVLTKTGRTPIEPARMSAGILRPAEFAESLLESDTRVYGRLAAKIDPHYLDLGLLDPRYPKFRLLNGWQLLEEKSLVRRAYRRARLFFSNAAKNNGFLNISVLAPYASHELHCDFEIAVDGEVIHRAKVLRGVWHDISIEPWKNTTPPTGSFFVEAGLHAGEHQEVTSFAVEREQLLSFRVFELTDSPLERSTEPELEDFGLETMLLTRFAASPMTAICGDDVDFNVQQINRMRPHANSVQLIVSEKQRRIYDWIPGVSIVGYYDSAPGLSLSADVILEGDRDRALKLLRHLSRPLDDGVRLFAGADGRIEVLQDSDAVGAGRPTGPALRDLRARIGRFRRLPLRAKLRTARNVAMRLFSR